MRQNLGQHFLTNKAVLKKIAAVLEIGPKDTLLEIGPGHGELTEFLLARLGAENRLVAIERDPALAAALQNKFGGPQFEVRTGDALKILPELASAAGSFVLAGNIPYYLTGFLLRTVSGLEHKPKSAVMTMQKEVAERIAALPPHMNRLSAAVRYWAEPKIIGLISRRDFNPPPEVDSATIILKTVRPETGAASENYYRALTALFQQPRKTILNNIAAALELPREEIAAKLRSAELEPQLRPQALAVADIIRISDLFLWT